MNLAEKAIELASKLANSFYDREPERPVFFTATELDLIEKWLMDMVVYELMKD
jgi:hypothetical protein